jgi:rod shape-determining protein MreB
VERGILLTGGTSLLRGMDEAIREVAGVAVVATEDPLATVALGLGRILEESPRYASFTT